MFFAVTSLIKQLQEENKPSYLFIENVKNLLSVNKGWDFTAMLVELDKIGYDAEWTVINSADVVAQNRERIFIIGHFRGRCTAKVFPIEGTGGEVSVPIKIIAHRKGYRRNMQAFDPTGITEALDTAQGGGRGHHVAIPVLTPGRAEKQQNGRQFKENGEPMFTLTSQDKRGILITQNEIRRTTDIASTLLASGPSKGRGNENAITAVMYQLGRGKNKGGLKNISPTLTKNAFEQNNFVVCGTTDSNGNAYCLDANYRKGITNFDKHKRTHIIFDGISMRRLTPLECFRLQTFPDELFYRASLVNSDSQLYKQAGNSVTVEVIRRIAERMRIENGLSSLYMTMSQRSR